MARNQASILFNTGTPLRIIRRKCVLTLRVCYHFFADWDLLCLLLLDSKIVASTRLHVIVIINILNVAYYFKIIQHIKPVS